MARGKRQLQQRAAQLAERPYQIEVQLDTTLDGEPVFVASCIELPGCMAQGKTPAAAVASLREATYDYVLSLIEDGLPVPDPAHAVSGTQPG